MRDRNRDGETASETRSKQPEKWISKAGFSN